ncbi:hypothetical protein MBAV_000627 [Candidatus Magnetobacterium bavaricum]|uniref:Uncharacterized protein n=1 Tax=Candidatus Magnetobacterium bavaricum TaxID=29290 RepID=A0A0F3GYY2_9BACT|nr:hypothetical protein MBAV_000627 [Candidatus Magnetobacterium bavaricum]
MRASSRPDSVMTSSNSPQANISSTRRWIIAYSSWRLRVSPILINLCGNGLVPVRWSSDMGLPVLRNTSTARTMRLVSWGSTRRQETGSMRPR